ncbi:MAG: hypothetical protein OXU74_16150 [Gemmatimonadota bacterium]|nr:hypothetical protein [Gemmatimonadota bacterium]
MTPRDRRLPRNKRRQPSQEDMRVVRQVMSRAIRRLNLLEAILLGAAAVAAVAGGWLAAYLGRGAFGWPFGTTWLAAAILLFGVPGVLAWTMDRRQRSGGHKQGKTGDDSAGSGGGQ